MSSPVRESDITVLSEVADLCDRLKSLLALPAQFKEFLGWLLDSAGEVSDAFVESIQDRLTPVGTIVLWGGTNLPSDRWLICNGQTIAIADYASLFQRYGVMWGGDGVTTMGLPDLRDRTPVGVSATKILGATGGSATVTLDLSHFHGFGLSSVSSSNDGEFTQRSWSKAVNGTTGSWFITGDDPSSVDNTLTSGDMATTTEITDVGSTDLAAVSVAIVPPYAAMYYLIKAR